MSDEPGAQPGDRVRQLIILCVALFGLAAIGILFVGLWINRFDIVATNFIILNWQAILGIPFSCIGAFIVVALFKQGAAPLEFEGLGFKFKGSAGEVVLWAMCFIVLVLSVHLLSSGKEPQLYGSQLDMSSETSNEIFSNQN